MYKLRTQKYYKPSIMQRFMPVHDVLLLLNKQAEAPDGNKNKGLLLGHVLERVMGKSF